MKNIVSDEINKIEYKPGLICKNIPISSCLYKACKWQSHVRWDE